MDKKVKIKVPMVPNFVFSDDNRSYQFDVGELSEKEIRELGAQWTEKLVVHAKNRSKQLAK